MKEIKRRDFLKFTGTLGLGATVFGGALARPDWARALEAAPRKSAETYEEAIKRLFGDKEIKSGAVTVEAPTIAETGNTVPVSADVESAMTDKDYVKTVYVIVEKNPVPEVAQFHFTPANGKAYISTRIKMAKTSKVHAIAETNTGVLYDGFKEVKVTLGGCGG